MNQPQNNISIVIINYNGVLWLKRLIESIADQSLKPREVILVDDLSSDESLSLVKENYPWVTVFQLKEKGFATRARNFGLQKASGDYVCFLDNDLYLDVYCLQHMSEYSTDFDVVVPQVLFENGVVFGPKEKGSRISGSISAAFMVKRESIEGLDEFFDETYLYHYEETDFFCRCYLFGLKVGYQPVSIVSHVIKERLNSERLFYLTVRNYLYGYLKYVGLKNPFFKKIFISLCMNFFVGVVLNRSWFDQSDKKKAEKLRDKVKDYLSSKKIGNSRSRNALLFLKAVWWNVINLNSTLGKNRKLKQRFIANI